MSKGLRNVLSDSNQSTFNIKRISMLDTIEEPMARDFQNTPYFNQSNNLILKILKNSELLTSTNSSKIIALLLIRSVLKT